MAKFGSVAYVLCYVPGHFGEMWCKVTIVQEWGNRYAVEFADGSGVGVFPKGDVYDQPDLRMCKRMQEL